MPDNSFSSFEKLIMENSSPGIKPGLERIEKLLNLIGNPQNKFPAIHVVGTNGKGSTAAFLNSILSSSGYKTALYTSPHLTSPGERLLINGEQLSENEWVDCAEQIVEVIKNDSDISVSPPSYFEVLTAVAFKLIEKHEVDAAVIEAGLGGRLDATNTLGDVIASVITSISIDHTEYLGETIEKIAFEKFSVVRDHRIAVYLGDNESLHKYFQGSILMRDARFRVISMSLEGNCYDLTWEQFQLNRLKTNLIGEFQIYNSALAAVASIISSARLPRINESTIRAGLFSAVWAGRMELIPYDSGKKYILLDGGHNEDGISKLVKSVRELFKSYTKIAVVYAAMKDKDIFGCLSHINKLFAPLFLTKVPQNERCASIKDLEVVARTFSWVEISCYEDALDAVNTAKKHYDLVLICGSLYFIGYVRSKII